MSTAVQRPDSQRAAASVLVQQATRTLLAGQDPEGWWPGPASDGVALAAEIVLTRELLGIPGAAPARAVAQQIRAAQQADGGWGGETGQISDPSVSVLAYLALRLAGDPADAYHMAAAAGRIRDAGGLESAGVSAQIWLAMFGLTEWEGVPVPSPEAVLVPARAMPGLAACAGGSRAAAVTAAILGALRPVHCLPLELSELRAGRRRWHSQPDRRTLLLASALRAAGRAVQPVTLGRCGQWLADWQQRPARPGGPRLIWPCYLVALDALGYPREHPAQAAGLAWLEEVSAATRPAAACVPPVRQSVLAVGALGAAGLAADHPSVVAAGRWLIGQRVRDEPRSGGVQTEPVPCGWSFGPDGYPRPADTAVVLLALNRVGLPGRAGPRVLGNAARWLARTQLRDGGWGCCTAHTAHAVHALACHPVGGDAEARAIRRGVVWLLRAQRQGGSWPGGPGGSDLLATAAALMALLAAGVRPAKPAVSAGADWLLGQQNRDGGWHAGDSAGAPRPGRSAVACTARAMAALLAVGGKQTSDGIEAAAGWLIRAQLAEANSPVLLAALGSYVNADLRRSDSPPRLAGSTAAATVC